MIPELKFCIIVIIVIIYFGLDNICYTQNRVEISNTPSQCFKRTSFRKMKNNYKANELGGKTKQKCQLETVEPLYYMLNSTHGKDRHSNEYKLKSRNCRKIIEAKGTKEKLLVSKVNSNRRCFRCTSKRNANNYISLLLYGNSRIANNNAGKVEMSNKNLSFWVGSKMENISLYSMNKLI